MWPCLRSCRHGIELEYVLDLIDVEIARYNATRSEGRFGLAPLDVLRQTVAGTGCPTLLPILPPTDALHPDLDVLTFPATVRGSLAKGRRPSIKFMRARYTNPVIAGNFKLVGADVQLHVRSRDLRTVDVFLQANGAALGTARVMGPWRREPHSLDLRLQINRYIDEGRLVIEDGIDPVTAMHRFLVKSARAQQRGKPTVSPAATALAHERQVGHTVSRAAASRARGLPSCRRAPTFRRHL
jgi:putative transposase